MVIATVEFPRSLLREQNMRLELGRRVVSPGLGGSGVLPLIATDGGGLWELDYGSVMLNKPDHVRAWEALAGLSDGGATPFVVPVCTSYTAPWPLDANGKRVTPFDDIPHDDDTMFSDDTGHYQPVVGSATFGGSDALLRATTLFVNLATGGPLRGGEHFSIFHPTAGWRLYRVVQIIDQLDQFNAQIKIRPPLREAVPSGTALEFDQPRCTMQLADPHAMDLTLAWHDGTPAARFIESFP